MLGRWDIVLCARFTSFHTHDTLLTGSVCFFILLYSCPFHARVLGENTRAWVSFIIVILNGTCFFPTLQLHVHNVYLERKSWNTCALVNYTSKLNQTLSYLIVAVPLPKCFVEHCFMSSTFSTAILNSTLRREIVLVWAEDSPHRHWTMII